MATKSGPIKKTKALTSVQKKYLARRILFYYYFSALVIHHRSIAWQPRRLVKSKPAKEVVPKKIVQADKPTIKFSFAFDYRNLPLPTKRLLTLFATLLFIVIIQLLYPHNRSLPLTRLESHGYLGFANKNQILKSFEDFDSRVITVHTHTKNLTTSYKDLGVTIQPDETVQSVTDYPLSQRLIPFSIFAKGNKTYPIHRDMSDAQLSVFVKDVIAEGNKQPVDAIATLHGTKIDVSKSEEGYEYQMSVLKSAVLRSDLGDKEQIVFPPTILQPNITTENAEGVAQRMQQRIDNPILINAESKNITIGSGTIASWVDIVHKPLEKSVVMSFNRSRVADSLISFPGQVDITAIPTVVTYLNGIQAGRVEGSVGKVLQFDDLVDRLVSTTSPSTTTLEALVTTVPPPEVLNRTYTRDSTGLQNLLDYWVSTNKGEYSIDLRSLNGRLVANVNPNRLFPSFGIYRNYIATMVYGKISSKSISPASVTSNGQNVTTCLSKMIILSDDGCTNALGALVGWGASDSILSAQGLESTTLTEGAGLTTANDASDWMIKLLTSNITTKQQADELTTLMSQQTFRSGIPSGSVGFRVADKAGASGRTKHDAGIVYHPKGTYVLSVLSDGSDFKQIADLTNEINKVMNQ